MVASRSLRGTQCRAVRVLVWHSNTAAEGSVFQAAVCCVTVCVAALHSVQRRMHSCCEACSGRHAPTQAGPRLRPGPGHVKNIVLVGLAFPNTLYLEKTSQYLGQPSVARGMSKGCVSVILTVSTKMHVSTRAGCALQAAFQAVTEVQDLAHAR